MKNQKIVLKEKINLEDFDQIKELENYCCNADGVSFKLELEFKLNQLKQTDGGIVFINDFMFYNDDSLIGYIGISDFGGKALEVNGMVHPDYRKKGIFTKLYSLVVDEWKKRKQNEMLLLCDKKSDAGIKFINNVCNTYDHSEYDMVLDMDFIPKLKQSNLNFRKAIIQDSKKVAMMDSLFFHADIEDNDEFIVENIENENTFIVSTNNTDVGKVRIELMEGVGGIYGLGIIPDFRGMGYGRELLIKSVLKLIEMGADKIVLQVETNNKNALNLYKSCGFRENYVMDYYKLSK